MLKTGAIVLGYVKLRPGALFHLRLRCDFQKLLRCHDKENFQHGYTGGVHVKIQIGMLIQFFYFKFGQILFFLGGGGVENGHYLFRLREAMAILPANAM